MSSKDTNCDALRQMISKTVAARFQASRRLDFHNRMSLFSISLFSIVLILVSLFQLAGFKFVFSDQVINIGQVFLTIVILCFSIAISMSDFSLRSSRFHECGIQLNELVYRLMNKWGVVLSDQDYDLRLSEYFDILKKYENHTDADNDRVNKEFCHLGVSGFKYYSRFFVYFLLIAMAVFWFFIIVGRADFI
ncbi:SLATT domain-containing protein [Pseudomonas syringae]|uniref:SLATT domain-containing protein n=1 Tax=Pseudomonas syringae TaxID=317 RepID=UPI0004657DBC|nr:SLATT domain-containing protein [Pseudomonas syringae]